VLRGPSYDQENFVTDYSKMIRNLIVLSFFFVAINAAGQLSFLSYPDSLKFSGDEALDSQYTGDVLSATLGNSIVTDANWAGLVIKNPFSLAKGIVALVIDGSDHVDVGQNAMSYALVGGQGGNSIKAFTNEMESNNVPVCDIDFEHFKLGVTEYKSCFGNVQEPETENTAQLKPTSNAIDKEFLKAIGYINAAAGKLNDMVRISNIVVFRVPLHKVARDHGEKSEATKEALQLLANTILKLKQSAGNAAQSDAVVVVVSEKTSGLRYKREVLPPNDKDNTFNLAVYYNQDYPVIFNIILWFMIVFGFALLAICYAIGSMDPGRDSIIYRMTSTRMKKDN